MKALFVKEAGKLEMIDIPKPEYGPEEVLIKINYVGLCGSDLNIYKGLMPLVTYPRIPCHEVSGIVEEKGHMVPDNIETGTKVTLSPYTSCGQCSACIIGRPNCCRYNQTLGVQRDGALTEYLAIHYSKIYSKPSLSLKELALAEPLSVGYHAANRAEVKETDTVLVLGCGVVGIGAITASARKGAEVIGLDIDDDKLSLVKKFGAQYTINSQKDDVCARVDELTDKRGVNVTIEAVGSPKTFTMAVDMAAYAGRVVYVDYAKEPVVYETKQFVIKELDIRGSRNSLYEFPAVLKMLDRHEYPFTELITKIYPFSELKQAFEDWDNDRS